MATVDMYIETFLISLAAMLLEVSYTRIFSYKLVYYFSYVIIGLALLGLGSGGVLVATLPRLRRGAAARVVPWACLAGGVAVVVGYLAIARVQLNLFQLMNAIGEGHAAAVLREGSRLVLVVSLVFAPFLAAGIALAAIFATHVQRIGGLYGADLIGASLGCAASVPLLALLSPPGCVLLVGGVLAAAGLRLGAASRGGALALGAVALAGLLGALFSDHLPEISPDAIKTRPSTFFHRWSPVFRVDVVPAPDGAGMVLAHDGTPGSIMRRWDGRDDSLAELGFDSSDRAYPFRLLAPGPEVAIIGAAGGHEILAALHFGASRVTAIELNPVTVSLLRSEFADVTGHLGEHPRVDLVNAEGRSFLAASDRRFDLIWLVAPDTYASMNAATAGAFVLSESYLYTREMILEALGHLTDDGLLCVQFGEISYDEKASRTLRYLATAREAFASLGVDDFARHVAVVTAPAFQRLSSVTILLRRRPFDEADVRRLQAAIAVVRDARLRHAWSDEGRDERLAAAISLRGGELERWRAEQPFLAEPVSDDSPFFWHLVRFRDAIGGRALPSRNVEEGVGERLLVLLLALVVLFGGGMLLVPAVAIRRVWREIPYKGRAAIYFSSLGIGFMFLEISLIQRLTLLLGYPTYSLTVTLFALLLSSGGGSLLSERSRGASRRALLVLAGGLALFVLAAAFALPPVIAVAVGWSLPARIAVAVGFLAPLGLCMGALMPIGLRTVAALTPHREEFVSWSWAVNGFCSVVSSVLATIVAMTVGLGAVMLCGLAVYLVGIAALLAIPERAAEASRTSEVSETRASSAAR